MMFVNNFMSFFANNFTQCFSRNIIGNHFSDFTIYFSYIWIFFNFIWKYCTFFSRWNDISTSAYAKYTKEIKPENPSELACAN